MAQTRKSKQSSTARSGSRRASGQRAPAKGRRAARRAQRRAERSHLIASLALLGAGLLVIALVLVRGQEESGWYAVRGWLFGLFGMLTYLVGPLLLYLAYLVASGYLVGKFAAKVGLLATLCASVPVVFSGFTVRDETFTEIIQMLFTWGRTRYWSGGVLGGIIGAPLLAFCSRPGANIILILILLLGLMVFFAVTPVDVVQFAVYTWQRLQAARQAAEKEKTAYDTPLFEGGPDEEPLETLTDALPAPAPAPATPAAAPHRALAANPFADAVAEQPAPEAAATPLAPPVPPPPTAPLPFDAAAQPQPDAPLPPVRAEFDVDLGPDIEQQALQNAIENDPLEPVIIGPGGTFGLDPLKNLGDAYEKPAQPTQEEVTEFDQHLDQPDAPAGEAAADELDELIQKAMSAPAQPPAETRLDLPVEEDTYDTALEPAPAGAGAAGAAAVRYPGLDSPTGDGGVGITPAIAFSTMQPAGGGVPTLGGSFDAARAAWDAGTSVADALTEPVDAGFADSTGYLDPAELMRRIDAAQADASPAHHTAAATRYRARLNTAKAAGQVQPAPAPAAQPDPAQQPEAAAQPEAAPKPAPAVEQAAPPKPYVYPSLDLFNAARPEDEAGAEREMRHNADVLVNTLDSFGVKTKILDICRGPSVTRYELQPQAGIKVSRITSLADDIALNLATAGVRIEAPIPGKPAVGIEVPNKLRSTVSIRTVFESQNYINMRSPLTMALGKDIAGVAQAADLCRMPHLLIAGSTGSGKSVCVNAIIISFLFRSSPEDVKLILIDPKVVELAEYNGIPHLLMPVVTEPRKAAGALGASVAEMERRYKLFADNNVREIKAYNRLAQNDPSLEHLPYIAIVIDELADLMMVAGKEVEDYICRIAQKARAAGIHLIVATQRPSVDVITGLIKANIPSRIAFAVSSQVDSRTILDSAGAEKLLGNGDMLFLPVGAAKPVRLQGTFVTDEEIGAVLDFIKSTSDAQYDEEMIAEMERRAVAEKGAKKDADPEEESGALDPAFEQAVECVIEAGQASTSMLQRRCKLGYARAARIMDQMEQEKIIGPYEGAKPRSVLVTMAQWQERKLSAGGNG